MGNVCFVAIAVGYSIHWHKMPPNTFSTNVYSHGSSIGNVTGYPGVFQGNPYPYPSKPVPAPTGTGFTGTGRGFSQTRGQINILEAEGRCLARQYESPLSILTYN